MKSIIMNPSPYDNNTLVLTIGTIMLGSITHWTANGIAAFCTIIAGTTAAIYNVVKIVEWWEKRKENRKK